MSLLCHYLVYIWAFCIPIANAFALAFKGNVFSRALVDPHFIFESASSVFTHHFILVKCSLSITDLNARTKAELKIAMEDKLSIANSVFVLIVNRKKDRKESKPAC